MLLFGAVILFSPRIEDWEWVNAAAVLALIAAAVLTVGGCQVFGKRRVLADGKGVLRQRLWESGTAGQRVTWKEVKWVTLNERIRRRNPNVNRPGAPQQQRVEEEPTLVLVFGGHDNRRLMEVTQPLDSGDAFRSLVAAVQVWTGLEVQLTIGE